MNQFQTIERILCSHTFANKEVLKGLLRFMFERYQEDKALKEADIAIGYFRRREDFMPGDDTIVRVNVYKLRMLLANYYSNEGLADEERVLIPKGRYCLIFSRAESQPVSMERSGKSFLRYVFPALLLLSAAINVMLIIKRKGSVSEPENPIFSSYTGSGKPVFITLGDPYFFRIKTTGKNSGDLVVRDLSLNSREQRELSHMSLFAAQNAAVSELSYPYFSRNNLWPLPDIISYFARTSVETRLQALSESNIDDIRNNNVVFIANINSFSWMSKFIDKSSIRLSVNPRQITILRDEGRRITLSVPEFVKGAYNDYAFLVKVPGPNNNQITMMGDFHASGLRGLSGFVNKPDAMRQLQDKIVQRYGHFPRFFEMLVKVTSVNYSDFDTRLIYFRSLE